MYYSRLCLDQTEYFPTLVTLPKEELIRQVYDPSLPGSSSAIVSHGSIDLCRASLGSSSIAKQANCKAVIAAKEALAKQQAMVRDLILQKASAEEVRQADNMREKLEKEVAALSERFCANCSYSKDTKAAAHRINYGRYGSKPETLAHTRTLLALAMIAHSSLPEGEDFLEPSDICISKLANITRLDQNSVRKSLRYWQDQGVIHYGRFGQGRYRIALTKAFVTMNGLHASDGGAGFITLPIETIRLMMAIDNIDLLRLFILTLLDVDLALHNRSFKASGDHISVNGILLKYVKRHQHASLSELLDRFNRTVNSLGETTVILHANASDQTSRAEDRYAQINIRIAKSLCPRQKSMPEAFGDLTRKLTAESMAEVDRARQEIFSGTPAPAQLMFPLPDGGSMAKEGSFTRPNSRFETLVPALESIQNNYGSIYIRHALVTAFRSMSDTVKKLFKTARPGSKELTKGVQELSAYMQAVARSLKNQVLSSRELYPEIIMA